MEKATKIVAALIAIIFVIILILWMFFLGFISISDILGDRAESMGRDTIDEASTGLSIESIAGYTNEERTKIEYLAITIKPRVGSTQIDLTKCSLTALYDTGTILSLNESLVEKNAQPFDNTIIDKLTSISFGVIVINDQDDSIATSYTMSSGDNAMLLVDLVKIFENEGLSTSESISCMLTPENGKKTQFDATAPAVFSNRVVVLN